MAITPILWAHAGVGVTLNDGSPTTQDDVTAAHDCAHSHSEPCPHCAEQLPATACGCCDDAASPGLANFDTPRRVLDAPRQRYRDAGTDRPPPSPPPVLFRPPILSV